MIIDASAVIAILRDEPEAKAFAEAIERATSRRISAVNWIEAAIVIDVSRNAIAIRRFDDFFRASGIAVEAVTPPQAETARAAYRDFGRGSGHQAKLNFGDCFAYALAKDKGEPLLFKGRDFIHTDIAPSD